MEGSPSPQSIKWRPKSMKCCRETQKKSSLDLCRNPSPSRVVDATNFKEEGEVPQVSIQMGLEEEKSDFY